MHGRQNARRESLAQNTTSAKCNRCPVVSRDLLKWQVSGCAREALEHTPSFEAIPAGSEGPPAFALKVKNVVVRFSPARALGIAEHDRRASASRRNFGVNGTKDLDERVARIGRRRRLRGARHCSQVREFGRVEG
jgi:hypothetical protein